MPSRFIKAYFPSGYHELVGDLWNFRNGMIHGFCPRTFFLTEHQTHLHLRETASGATVLNAEDFYAALLEASRAYFAEIEKSSKLEANMLAHLQSPQGGNIAVGPIEIG